MMMRGKSIKVQDAYVKERWQSECGSWNSQDYDYVPTRIQNSPYLVWWVSEKI